jgi:nitrate/nitrite-specific signal transduction histidine kinase
MDTGHAMVTVLCISCVFLFSGLLIRSIKKLQNGAEIIAGGNLDHRIDIHTGDEIEQLAKSFNIMGEKLKGFYTALEDNVR